MQSVLMFEEPAKAEFRDTISNGMSTYIVLAQNLHFLRLLLVEIEVEFSQLFSE